MIEGASPFWVLLEVTKSRRQLHGKGRTNVVQFDLPARACGMEAGVRTVCGIQSRDRVSMQQACRARSVSPGRSPGSRRPGNPDLRGCVATGQGNNPTNGQRPLVNACRARWAWSTALPPSSHAAWSPRPIYRGGLPHSCRCQTMFYASLSKTVEVSAAGSAWTSICAGTLRLRLIVGSDRMGRRRKRRTPSCVGERPASAGW